jgi:hypothetical protein
VQRQEGRGHEYDDNQGCDADQTLGFGFAEDGQLEPDSMPGHWCDSG